ncbi:iron chaperone [Planctomyces sp. SH-PL14]|uniref:iron chaperone n=1 Tax=Planctomyces sp. SH-PL14 TaxID=1632864 RepID=UPI00078D43FC|nr:DUF1801 domain-containing protein [Planctomyces sp. SH-PL14]AMV20276.1 hypothetical protein VT03_20430 [Planctomyces sp. SH-PL14]
MKPATVDDYIAQSPEEVRPILEKIRATIRRAAPKATERISYRMPAFFQDGVLVYIGAFKNHIGLYPPVCGDEALEAEVAPYEGEKGNLRFPLDRPIPYGLIGRIVKSHVRENAARAAAKASTARSRRSGTRSRG